jgi:hypothetical protein
MTIDRRIVFSYLIEGLKRAAEHIGLVVQGQAVLRALQLQAASKQTPIFLLAKDITSLAKASCTMFS